MLDLLSLPTSRRDWAILIGLLSLLVGASVLAFGGVNARSMAAASAAFLAIVVAIISALVRRSVGIPLCVLSGILPVAGIAFLAAPQ